MHVVFREHHGLEETATPRDLCQDPAELVVLSFSDSDLGAFAAGWHAARGGGGPVLPSLRLANLADLAHPLSVDTYLERTLSGAKGILIRLIGGRSYWSYGLQQVEALARSRGIALAVLAADGRQDERLAAASTVAPSTLRRLDALCGMGGAVAAQAALAQLALAAGLYAGPVRGVAAVAMVGAWAGEAGVDCPAAATIAPEPRPRVLLVFYRAYLLAADLDPIAALRRALEDRGFDAIALFVPSLKDAGARGWLVRWVAALAPVAILNATAFSGRGDAGDASPLDAAGAPVFQVALATSTAAGWAESTRGLSPADLAMHVVLPEVDGRIFAGVASFKQDAVRDPDLQHARRAHRADPARVSAIVDRVAGWVTLARTPPAERRIALVLSTYPGKRYQMAHAVGLDAIASAEAILADVGRAGGSPGAPLADALGHDRLCWPLAAYHAALAGLPPTLREQLAAAWGPAEDDPIVADGAFRFAATMRGTTVVALQPERGATAERSVAYHDLARVPRHGYVAFYLWLRAEGIDALVHVGAHGTLEWLPGKAVALSDACWPEALTGRLPIVYPYIVNDPGEAAQAKRRIGAVTIGHLPPPQVAAGHGAGLGRLEALLDEFSTADGLDPARRDRLQADIADEAQAIGLAAELGLADARTPAEAIARIDAFVCDVKDSRFGDGLHVFGTGECGAAERAGLHAALTGRRVAAGPAGSPHRGGGDVLPTGRNLYTLDPRAIPSPAAYEQGRRLADELVRRHVQDEGDYLRTLVVDLWGSATMRTAGEDFAMALHLLGAAPAWDAGSGRVTGVEILPLAMLDRPRVDVTLRISGLFRDTFAVLCALFGQAVRALAARDEPADWNPFAGHAPTPRVYGPAPGRYGLGIMEADETYADDARMQAGAAWLAASSHAFDGDGADGIADAAGLHARVAAAGAFVHMQDLPETDLLLAADYAGHEAGFAAAQAVAGGRAALYHLDARDPARPRARPLREEIARIVRARAANPAWIDGMMRHGYRGAAEIAATLDHLGRFAHLARVVGPELIDLYHEATLGREDVRAFMAAANPDALAALRTRFAALHRSGLWPTRRNATLADLA